MNVDIAIIGGGMAGLSMVELCARYLPSKRVALFEQFPLEVRDDLYQPSFDYRSTAISRDSADIFDSLGLWQQIGDHATEIQRVHVSDRGHAGLTSFDRSENRGSALGYVVDNAWLGRVLIQSVLNKSNATCIAPSEVSAIRFTEQGAHLQVKSAEHGSLEVNCELAIVADGAGSVLRQRLGIDVDTYNYEQSAVIANVEHQFAHEGVAYERFTESGPVAFLPHGESNKAKASSIVWTTPSEKVDDVLRWSDDKFLATLQHTFGFRLGALTKVGVRHHYPLKRVVAKEQVRTSVVLMGNAAHALHPVAGQGFNLALRDALCLVKTLSSEKRDDESLGALRLLQRYVDKQQADQWLTTMMSHSFNRVFADDRNLLRAFRNFGLIGMNLCQPVKHTFFNQMMGKGVVAAQ